MHRGTTRRPVAAAKAFFINQKVVFVSYRRRIIDGCYRTADSHRSPPTEGLPLSLRLLNFIVI